MVGVDPFPSKVSAFNEPLAKIQLLFEGVVSPKINRPRVGAISIEAVLSVVNSTVKLAESPAKYGIFPPDQFPESSHLPPVVVRVQTPSVAKALEEYEKISAITTRKVTNLRRDEVRLCGITGERPEAFFKIDPASD